jgi:two-component system, OmpR family, phosphate regulon response regulator PhoB
MPKRIMIIEDDLDIMDIMTYILKDKGYEVVSSGNSSILSEVDENYPDLILLDNRLPEGLGLEICKQYKQKWKDEGKVTCPVIIISADHELETLAKRFDADGFLEKPFDVTNFLATIKKYTKDNS